MNWLKLKLRVWLGLPLLEAKAEVSERELRLAKARIAQLESDLKAAKKDIAGVQQYFFDPIPENVFTRIEDARKEAKAGDIRILGAAVEAADDIAKTYRESSQKAILSHVNDALVMTFKQLGIE